MYERSAIVLEKNFNTILGFDQKTNLKTFQRINRRNRRLSTNTWRRRQNNKWIWQSSKWNKKNTTRTKKAI